MKRVALVFVVVTATYAVAFRPELADSVAFYLTFGLPHLLLAAYAVQKLHKDGTLAARITPRGGDLSIGAVVGLGLLAASWGARAVLAPTGSPRQAWLWRLYLQLGDPDALQHSVLLTSLLCLIVVCEELVWRGLVLEDLTERFGTRRGWIFTALLYALAALPTVYHQRDPFAGPNPLLVVAAFGCGLVWTFMAARFGRLLPSVVSHLVFSYFSAVQFRWPV